MQSPTLKVDEDVVYNSKYLGDLLHAELRMIHFGFPSESYDLNIYRYVF